MLTYEFPEFPVIETERLILRGFTMDDIDAVYKLRTDRDIMKNIYKDPMQTRQEAIEMIKKMNDDYASYNGVNWGITIKPNPTIVGGVGFWRIIREHYRAELGYSLLPPFWGKGYISEAVKAVLDIGLGPLNLHSIEANIDPVNLASAKILEKNGFVKEGYFKEDFFFHGEFFDTLTYGLVKK